MELKWFVLRSKSNNEKLLYQQVILKNIECFFPEIKVNPVNPRAAKVRPLFPNYMFVKVDLELLGKTFFKWMPFGLGLVSFDGEPAIISDEIIQIIKHQLKNIEDGKKPQLKQFVPGTKVRIVGGSLKGYEGIVGSKLSGRDRVQILLKIISDHHVQVDFKLDQVNIQQ